MLIKLAFENHSGNNKNFNVAISSSNRDYKVKVN